MFHSPKKRVIYIDNLRFFLIILVILFHISIIYGAVGGSLLKETLTDKISPLIFNIFNTICQSFFMSLFFLLSGYFTPQLFDENGAKSFFKERLIRLGIPLILYITFFRLILDYITFNFIKGKTITLASVFFYDIKNPSFAVGYLWFLAVLLLFVTIYTLFRLFINTAFKPFNKKFPSNKVIIGGIICLPLLIYFIRYFFKFYLVVLTYFLHFFSKLGIGFGVEGLPFFFGHLVYYIFFFWIGIVSYRCGWIKNLSDKQAKIWKIVAIFSIITLPVFFIIENPEKLVFGVSFQSLLFIFWESIACFSIIISLIAIFKRRFNKQGKLVAFMAPNSYTAYIISELITIIIATIFLNITIPAYIKFILVSLIVIPVCFVASYLIRKIPYTKKVLG